MEGNCHDFWDILTKNSSPLHSDPGLSKYEAMTVTIRERFFHLAVLLLLLLLHYFSGFRWDILALASSNVRTDSSDNTQVRRKWNNNRNENVECCSWTWHSATSSTTNLTCPSYSMAADTNLTDPATAWLLTQHWPHQLQHDHGHIWPPQLQHGCWHNTDRPSYSMAADTTLTSDVRLVTFIPALSELIKLILHHWS